MGETWINSFSMGIKQQSKPRVSSNESAPKIANVGMSANKNMMAIF